MRKVPVGFNIKDAKFIITNDKQDEENRYIILRKSFNNIQEFFDYCKNHCKKRE